MIYPDVRSASGSGSEYKRVAAWLARDQLHRIPTIFAYDHYRPSVLIACTNAPEQKGRKIMKTYNITKNKIATRYVAFELYVSVRAPDLF